MSHEFQTRPGLFLTPNTGRRNVLSRPQPLGRNRLVVGRTTLKSTPENVAVIANG
jgi:hypothetical protein